VRILVLNQYFHPDVSATSQLLTELCEDLALHHDVYVVTGRPSYNPVERTKSRGLVSRELYGRVRVARVWSTSLNRSGMAGRLTNYGTYLVTSVAGAFSVSDPDVVVALTDPPPIGLIGGWTARLRRRPFVLVTKDIFPEVAVRLGKLTDPRLIAVLRRAARSLFRRADVVVSIGRDMTERLVEARVPRTKIRLIRDWADGTLIRPLDGVSRLRQERGWEGRFVVMQSGNVGLSQSLDTLVEAADRLRVHPDIVFAIVGEGASKADLRRRATALRLENVEFLPYQPKASLADSLGAADVHFVGLRRGLAGYIVPSKVYGIMAAGKPFIAAVDDGSEPALIAAEVGCGIRIEPDEPSQLAEAILQLRAGKPEEMGLRGRAEFERSHDRPLATEEYRGLLEEVVAAGGADPTGSGTGGRLKAQCGT
jgi:glycosyltransferase involved in cell wall biosynthesis